MLKFVLGRSGSGKTEYCFSEIKELVLNGNNDILLLTPEQYNFTAEKKLLTMLGESRINCVQNLSFTRLDNEISRVYGGNFLPVLSNGAKAVLMKRAVDSVKDNLTVFTRKTSMSSFIKAMVRIYDEMKSCDLSGDDIKNAAERIDRKQLSDKLIDMSLIINEYENIIDGKYYDASDYLSRLYAKLENAYYFKGKTVFIDGFNGFASSEFKILKLIIEEAETVVITLVTDTYKENNEYDLFSYVNKTVKKLEKAAKESGVEIEYIDLDKNLRTAEEALINAEKYIFRPQTPVFDEEPSSIHFYRAKNTADECNYTALTIKKLLRNGTRAKDIAVICRNLEKYKGDLSYAFKKYEVPYFDDERQEIRMQPLMVFVQYLLRCVIYSFRSDDILSLAKTGLTNLNSKEISSLENYIFLWGINGVKKWGSDFENSTKGFTSDISKSDSEKLSKINNSRDYLYKRLNKFKYEVKGGNSQDISKAIYETLLSFSANKNLKNLSQKLTEYGKDALASEQERVWDLLMQILNDLAVVLDGENITLKEYYELFCIMVLSEDLGVLPQGIDNVQFGQADRVRADSPKIVFILGANEGEFPQAVSSGGLLSENDRIILNNNDFELYSFGETLNFQEKYFAYMAVSAPSEALYISYEGSGKSESPSVIVSSLQSIYPNARVLNSEDIDLIEYVESKASAFDLAAKTYADNSPLSASLKEYFKNDSRLFYVKLLSENDDLLIKNTDNAVKLFGKDMYLSASRLEDYFNCPFRYFCKFGLIAKPREKAELNAMQSGTAIHYVLENILKNQNSSISSLSSAQLKVLVDKYLMEYFETQLGNTQELNTRFKYRFMRLSKMLYSVVLRLAQEFSQSDFEAKAFELKIDKDGDVKPQIIPLESGSVQIRGAVDRVDVLEKNGKKYVRVVDYKSGQKQFSLSDVLYGLNLQMFVYLFTICSDKSSEFCGIPAGVLYMHAARTVYSLSKKNTDGQIAKGEDKEYKMKGIVLYDEENDILESMEKDLKGKYIPVKMSSKGLAGCFASYEELGIIAKKIISLIAQMGNSLHCGNINQNPINMKNHDKTCDYCDYKDVCANRRIIEPNEAETYSDEKVIEILKEE